MGQGRVPVLCWTELPEGSNGNSTSGTWLMSSTLHSIGCSHFRLSVGKGSW